MNCRILGKTGLKVSESVRQHYLSLKTNASDCIMCGTCEPNCPFGVNVRENMEKAQIVFAKK